MKMPSRPVRAAQRVLPRRQAGALMTTPDAHTRRAVLADARRRLPALTRGDNAAAGVCSRMVFRELAHAVEQWLLRAAQPNI